MLPSSVVRNIIINVDGLTNTTVNCGFCKQWNVVSASYVSCIHFKGRTLLWFGLKSPIGVKLSWDLVTVKVTVYDLHLLLIKFEYKKPQRKGPSVNFMILLDVSSSLICGATDIIYTRGLKLSKLQPLLMAVYLKFKYKRSTFKCPLLLLLI